jgi:hypothetical protein
MKNKATEKALYLAFMSGVFALIVGALGYPRIKSLISLIVGLIAIGVTSYKLFIEPKK